MPNLPAFLLKSHFLGLKVQLQTEAGEGLSSGAWGGGRATSHLVYFFRDHLQPGLRNTQLGVGVEQDFNDSGRLCTGPQHLGGSGRHGAGRRARGARGDPHEMQAGTFWPFSLWLPDSVTSKAGVTPHRVREGTHQKAVVLQGSPCPPDGYLWSQGGA